MHRFSFVLTLLVTLCVTSLSPAGPLSPPAGPVASTPGPEPRIAINATNTPGTSGSLFTISQPGSYYLTSNISIPNSSNWAITIFANGVTLDLNGFTIDGNYNTPSGGIIAYGSGTIIRNGTITRTSTSGITASNFPVGAQGMIIESIRVIGVSGSGIPSGGGSGAAGAAAAGIFAGRGAIIRNCYVTDASLGIAAGYNARVSDCTVEFARQYAFYLEGGANISGCVAVGTSGGPSNGGVGFFLGTGSSIDRCVARSNSGAGFVAQAECLLTNCSATNNTASGFSITDRCRLAGSIATSNISVGVTVSGNKWDITESSFTSNAQGGISLVAGASQGRITSCNIRGIDTTTNVGIRVPTSCNDINISRNSIGFVNTAVQLDGGFVLVANNSFNLVSNVAITSTGTNPAASNIIAPVVTAANIASASNPFANTLQ